MTGKTPEHLHVEELAKTKIPISPIYNFLLSDISVTAASKGSVVCRLLLTASHMNSGKSLHGAVSAAIVDWAGGMAIATHDLRSASGPSLDIHVTYLSGARVGDEIEIEGIAEKVGGSIGFTRVTIYKVEGGTRSTIVSTGTHTKYVKGTAPTEH